MRVKVSKNKNFSLGFLLDPDLSALYLELCDRVGENPHELLEWTIETMHKNAFEEETNE